MNISPHRLARKVIHRASHVIVPRHEMKVVQTSIQGFKLLVLVNEDVGREIRYLGRYEPADSAFLAGLVEAEDICVDVGANTGYYTMLMAHRAGRGEVHAFEPVAFNWHLLNCNVVLNTLTNVQANRCALGSTSGFADFSQAADGAYSSLVAVGRQPEAQRIQVPVDTLDAYLDQHAIPRVDVIKIDVEGAEKLVLKGANKLFLDPVRRPRVAMIELFERNLEAYDTSIEDIVRLMAGFGYKAFCVSRESGKPMQFDAKRHRLIYNVFFIAVAQLPQLADVGAGAVKA